jgi:hypothetical protein
MPLNRQYAKEIHDQFGYFPTWLPTAAIKLGEVGTISNGIFERIGTLMDFDISHTEQVDPQTGDLEYASKDAVSVEFKATGQAPAGAAAGAVGGSIAISFSRSDAVLFQASRCKTSTLANLRQVADQVLSRYRSGEWPREQVVVTEIVSCAAATVLISSGANGQMTLAVKGGLGANKAKLADVDGTFEVKSSSAIGLRILAQKDATPLFKASGIKTSLLPWGDPSFRTRAVDSDLQLAPLDYQELVGPPPERAG